MTSLFSSDILTDSVLLEGNGEISLEMNLEAERALDSRVDGPDLGDAIL